MPIDDPREHLVFLLGRAYYAYVGLVERLLADAGLDEHIRSGMGAILFSLFEADDCSIKELAARVQLSLSTMTGLLVRMESGGLIERYRDANDRRVVRVRLTTVGRAQEPRSRLVIAQLDNILNTGMGADGVTETRRLLGLLTTTMRAGHAGAPAAGPPWEGLPARGPHRA